MKKAITIIAVTLFLYCAAYGVARWRKFIVMDTYNQKEEQVFVRQVGSGYDIRNNWRGHLKNKLDSFLFVGFYPLEVVENHLRGCRRPLPFTQKQPPNQ